MFGRKTLDQILGGFEDLKVELLDHINHQKDEMDGKADKVAKLNVEIQDHAASADRAQRVLENINNLVGA